MKPWEFCSQNEYFISDETNPFGDDGETDTRRTQIQIPSKIIYKWMQNMIVEKIKKDIRFAFETSKDED